MGLTTSGKLLESFCEREKMLLSNDVVWTNKKDYKNLIYLQLLKAAHGMGYSHFSSLGRTKNTANNTNFCKV